MKHEQRNDDPRLTAYVLGELDGDEKARFERELEANEAMAVECRALRSLGDMLSEELEGEPVLLSSAQRAAIARQAGDAAPNRGSQPGPQRLRRVGLGFGLSLAVAAAVLLYVRRDAILGSGNSGRNAETTARFEGASITPFDGDLPKDRLQSIGYAGGDGREDQLSAEQLHELRSLGYTSGDDASVASLPQEMAGLGKAPASAGPAAPTPPTRTTTSPGRLPSTTYAPGPAGPTNPGPVATGRGLVGSVAGGGPAATPGLGGGGATRKSGASQLSATEFEPLEAIGYVDGEDGPTPDLRYRAGVRVLPDRQQQVARGSDGFFLGRGESQQRRPAETPYLSREAYDHIQENDFLRVADAPLSTFSIDVDTASYANVRRYLRSGSLPPADAVRIEELINYFSYDDPAPTGSDPFSVTTEVGRAPWNSEHLLLRVGLKGRPVTDLPSRTRNLTFLVDVSGSMESADKLPLLKRAMRLLVDQLGPNDRVAIVVYAGSSGLVLPSTACSEKATILESLERLQAGGSTAGAEGIQLAYRTAREHFLPGGINRVLLATDGDFNVGISDQGSLVRLIETEREGGISLSVLGFGTGNLQDSKMEQLADHGNGNYSYIDSVREAQKVLVHELGGTLETIAKDVKIQIEFNPSEIAGYRLIGYENRKLADADFNDDTKDAGEIGAGHNVTALFELVPAGLPVGRPGIDPLRYQDGAAPQPEGFPSVHQDELLNVKLRYKAPGGSTSKKIEHPVRGEAISFAECSPDLRFAASVAAFGMLLRHSAFVGNTTFEDVMSWTGQSLAGDPFGYRAEFLDLVDRAGRIQSPR